MLHAERSANARAAAELPWITERQFIAGHSVLKPRVSQRQPSYTTSYHIGTFDLDFGRSGRRRSSRIIARAQLTAISSKKSVVSYSPTSSILKSSCVDLISNTPGRRATFGSSGSSYTEQVLYCFKNKRDGFDPTGPPSLDGNYLYGTTNLGGVHQIESGVAR
ncbi:MAG: hypothetical protein WAL67_01910 [Candidatus Cybelea sp.]